MDSFSPTAASMIDHRDRLTFRLGSDSDNEIYISLTLRMENITMRMLRVKMTPTPVFCFIEICKPMRSFMGSAINKMSVRISSPVVKATSRMPLAAGQEPTLISCSSYLIDLVYLGDLAQISVAEADIPESSSTHKPGTLQCRQ